MFGGWVSSVAGLLIGATLVSGAIVMGLRRLTTAAASRPADFEVADRRLFALADAVPGWGFPGSELGVSALTTKDGAMADGIERAEALFLRNRRRAFASFGAESGMIKTTPCRWAVQETAGGRIDQARPNPPLLRRSFAGIVGRTLFHVAHDERRLRRLALGGLEETRPASPPRPPHG